MRDIKVMKNYKFFFAFSGIVIIAGIIMMLFNGLNLGIDFTGGTMMQIEIGKTVTVNEIKEAISEFKLNADIVHTGENKTGVVIKTKESLNNENRQFVFDKLQATFSISDENMKNASSEQFGPAMGKEISQKALISVLIASAAMLVYIAFRFELVFGVAAITALAHDVLFVISIYAIFGITINSSFIAAILTIVGYSINDTIVVFDRVRENVKREKTKDHAAIIDTSISQTIGRTLNTSLTTLLVIASLMVFGATSIKEFAFPLFVGIAVGTYSSMFIASPVWAIARNYIGKKGAYGNK